MQTKVCRKCGDPKDLEQFRKVHGKEVRRNVCRKCETLNCSANPARRSELAKARRISNPVQTVWVDSRRSDRKKGLENDLTKDFIRAALAQPCRYCGETHLRMTLDRIDNDKGHLMSNVVPACLRCNYTRGNMPYEAWLCLLPGLREAREKGLFGSWVGRMYGDMDGMADTLDSKSSALVA